METIKQIFDRKIQLALNEVREARLQRDKMIAEATTKGDQLVQYHQGRLDALDNLADLDWNLYAKNTLESK